MVKGKGIAYMEEGAFLSLGQKNESDIRIKAEAAEWKDVL